VRFDAKRPVPWRRLLTMFALYAVVANLFLYFSDRKHYGLGVIAGTLLGGMFYLALASIMAKFGWAPKSLAESRAARAELLASRQQAKAERGNGGSRRGGGASPSSDTGRSRPAPTRRTASGVGRQRPPAKRPAAKP
jgi:hypothetical protein